MGNLILGYSNLIDESALSGGSWESSLPLTNLQDRMLGVVARSSDALMASTQFTIALPENTAARLIALANHNMSLGALYRITGSSDPTFATAEYQSEWAEVWPRVYNSTDLDWRAPNWWSGKYTERERAGYNWTLVHDVGSAEYLQNWRIEIDDQDHADGFVQIGRLFIGPAWAPPYGMSVDADGGWSPNTDFQRTRSGAKVFDRRPPARVFNFNTEGLTDDQAMQFAFEVQRMAGIDQEVVFVFDDEDTKHALRRRFLATLQQLSPIRYPAPNIAVTGWSVEETL